MRVIWEEFQHKGIVNSDYDDDDMENISVPSGDGFYLRCFNVRRIDTGIYLRSRPMLAGVYENGL